ncbi:MAG: transcriptional regulator [Aquificae bacterium]|nr:transcriptional regulator [Aquificota bacterium]
MRFSLLVAIIDEELEDKAIDVAEEKGAVNVSILNARGLSLSEEKKTFFGFTLEGAQSILVFVVERTLSIKIMKALNKELELEKPDRGVAFIIPIEHIAGVELKELLKFQEEIKKEL